MHLNRIISLTKFIKRKSVRGGRINGCWENNSRGKNFRYNFRSVQVVVVVQWEPLDFGQDVDGLRVVSLLETNFTGDSHRRNLSWLREVGVEVVWLERRLHKLEWVSWDSVSLSVSWDNLDLRDRSVEVVVNFTSRKVDEVVIGQHSPSRWGLSSERRRSSSLVVWLKRGLDVLPSVGWSLVPLSVGVLDEVFHWRKRSSLFTDQHTGAGVDLGLVVREIVLSRERWVSGDLDSRSGQVTWRSQRSRGSDDTSGGAGAGERNSGKRTNNGSRKSSGRKHC